MEHDNTAISRPANGGDTPRISRTNPISSHFRQLGNTLSQSVVVVSAMESLTGTTKRISVPATLRSKEISLICSKNSLKYF